MNNNCRNNTYPGTKIKRFSVPIEKVHWEVKYDEYNPPTYTSPAVINKPWADPEIGSIGFLPEWNSNKGKVNRACGSQKYDIDTDGYPINPIGRTGLKGRGLLGRWGPNCAGDAIVTRWKVGPVTGDHMFNSVTGRPVLQFIAIKRRDCGEWAIPGGFADNSEEAINTVKREFLEEALNSQSEEFRNNKDKILAKINEIFMKGTQVHSGYVDDRRNTDQAWISTTAINFHDESGETFHDIKLQAGDDAKDVAWLDLDRSLKLYANHKDFIQMTATSLNGHF